MSKNIKVCALAAIILAASPANAEDDPNAAIAAQTARLNAETAQINAQAALTTAKAAKDKAGIEALGLPKFESKTELVEKGGAIETAMLASRAVSAAAATIASNPKLGCPADQSPIIVLAGTETFDLNSAAVMFSRINYYTALFDQAKPRQNWSGTKAFITPTALIGLASAAAGLFGNDVKVSGVELPELNNATL